MKVLKASEDGRCERLFTRSSRGWSLPVVVVASVLMVPIVSKRGDMCQGA